MAYHAKQYNNTAVICGRSERWFLIVRIWPVAEFPSPSGRATSLLEGDRVTHVQYIAQYKYSSRQLYNKCTTVVAPRSDRKEFEALFSGECTVKGRANRNWIHFISQLTWWSGSNLPL